MASRKERHPSDLTSSKCTSGDTASSKKDSNQQPVAEQAGPAASLHSKGLNSVKTSGVVDTKVSQLPLDSKSRQSTASPNFSRSTLQNQSLKPMNKVPQLAADSQGAGIVKGGGYPMRESSSFSNQGHRLSPNNGPCDFQSDGLVKGGYPYLMRENSSFSNQGKRVFPNNGPTRNMSNGRTWDGNDRFKFGEKFQRNRELKPCCETNRGPRARGGQTSLSSPPKNDPLGLRLVQREKYNLPNFETKYENAKFFVIKSYNEEDIHKSIKYDVWASTPHGNRKLDAAFHDAERISSETSKTCPIFLFFSANGSGQFVGLAEMTGPVDFEKDMDFWQKNKWNGFLPLEWHIIKDIPNNQLRHIILENNENKPVTYTRDTQEVGFKQGSEMLAIFKSYPAKTMLLDDFDFYENQEKSPPDRSCKAASPQIITYGDRFLGCSSLMVPELAPISLTEATSNSASVSDSRFTTTGDGPELAPIPPTEATSNSSSISDSRFATSGDDVRLPHAHSYDYYKSDADQKCGVFNEATSKSALISNSRFATTGDDVRLPHAHSYDNYKSDADQKRGVFNEGDMVMVYQKRQMDAPHKLQMRRIGPFPILKRVNDKAYKVGLPPNYCTSNTFNVANLTPYKGSIVPPVRLPVAPHRLPIASDRISVALMKDTVVTSRRTYSMFLVKLKSKDTWLSEKSFQQMDPEFYERYMAAIDREQAEQARQTEEDGAKTPTTS